ncbi:PAS domain-containing protein [Dechloromonas sp. A34]|uniref:PAS domain-containing protein n=1 Tax=Dechloromonas sp. A34 TaxID=447588 RepID=UPI002248846F|nr:PAS domain S-box protein [Dechloromonas sp. A34]
MLPALTIAFIYAAFAALWILLSDKAVAWLFTDPTSILMASTLKGWVFVAVTAFLLYALMRRRAPSATLPPIRLSRTPLVVLAIVIVALTAVGVTTTVTQQQEKEVARLQAIADLKAQQVTNWLKERQGDAEFVQTSAFFAGQYQRWRTTGDASIAKQLHDRLEQFRKSRGFAAVIMLDHNGQRLWASTDIAAEPSADLRQTAQRAARDGQIHRMNPEIDAAGKVHLDLVVPLTGIAESPPLIILRANLADWLFLSLETWPVPSRSAESVLFRRDGEQIVFLNELRHHRDSAEKLRFPIVGTELLATKVLRGDAAVGEAITGRDYRDVPVIGIIRAIAGTDWFMIAKMDRAELYREGLKDAAWVVLAGLLCLFAAGVGSVVLRQRQQLLMADGIRKSQEERIRALNLLGAIADASDDAIFAKDQAGRYLLFNRAAEQITGKQAGDVLGEDDTLLFPAEQAALLMANDRQVMQDKRPVTFQEKVRTATGEAVFLATKGPLRDANDNIIGMFGISRDITARQAAEDALRESEKRFQDIVTASADWIWEVDRAWRYTYVSDSVTNLLGYAAEEILGKTPFDLMPPEEAERVRALLESTIARQLPIRNLENISLCKDGSLCHVLTSGIPILDSHGILLGYRGLDHDITDKKYTELFLRQQAEGLSQRNSELERFNQAMVGREIEMIELKKKINELSRQLGQEPPHRLSYLDSTADPYVADKG